MADEIKKPNTDEIASAATDIYLYQGYLQVLENPDEVLNLEAGGDITVYDRIGRDPRVAASLRTRAKAVTGKEWLMVPFSQETKDIQIAEYVKQVFLNFSYDRCRRPVLRGGVLKGFAVAEVMWDYSEGDTFINNMHYRHQRRFKFGTDNHLYLLTLENPYPGENVTINKETGLLLKKFQVFTFGDEVTTPYGNGLGTELYWPWWFKKNDIKFWLMFCDKFAAPTAVGEYPQGTTPEKQRELLAAAQSIHSNSSLVYPAGMNLRLIEAARNGSVTCYKELVDFCNDEMTISILGQTATTSGTPGKLGSSDEQADVRSDYLKDDADSICEAQNDRKNGVIPWLVDYQFPGHGRYPKIWIKTESEEDGKTLAERDDKLASAMANSGLQLTRSYYIRTHSLDETDIEAKQQAAPSIPSTKSTPSTKQADTAEFSEHRCPHCSSIDLAEGGEPDAVDNIAKQALEDTDTSDLVARIRKHIDDARDLNDALDTLPDLRKELKIDQIAELLPRAAIVARLTGRTEVMNEVTGGEEVQFAESISLPFDQAIKFFKQKLSITSETWTDLWQGEHSRQFTVAGVMRDDMLEDFRTAIEKAITDGTTHADFLKEFDRIVETYGWDYNGARGWRSRVIYETNIRTAYNAGRWQQLTDPDLLSVNPYLEYRHGDSKRPRPLHVSWSGTVLPANDPWWNTHYTPNGWGCKCKVLSAGPRDLKKMGKTGPDKAPDNGTYEWVDKKTGEIHEIPKGIDPGWAYNPGKEWLNPRTGKLEKL